MIRPRYQALVLTGAYTGLRPGELVALRLDRLDLLRRQLRVEEPVKTPAARRTVSFPAFLAETLAVHLTDHPGQDGWGYCVFGQVVEGMDVVNEIKDVATGNHGYHSDVPREPIVITEVSVIEG